MARVLVVEDDSDILNLVKRRLEMAKHQVATAGSASEALLFVDERGCPDLVVLDIGLPDLDGLELLKKLRERDGMGELPAVFLSARVQTDQVAAGRDLGAIYLTKPFVAAALLSAVERSLPGAGSW